MRSYMVALGLLLIALGHPSFAQTEATEVRVAAGAPLAVECPLRVEQRAEWRRDGAAPPPDMRPGAEAPRAGRVTVRLTAPVARAAHAGLYTCSREPGAAQVRVLVLPAPADASAAAASEPTPDLAAEPEDVETVMYDVRGYFSLNCTSPSGISATYSWKKNDSLVETVADLKDRYQLEENGAVFRLSKRSTEDDYGNYTCLVDGAIGNQWRVHARPVARLPHNSNVVQGQKLKLTCKLIGKPYVPVAWTFQREGANATDVATALGDRVKLSPTAAGVFDGELVLEEARLEDAGVYNCTPVGGTSFSTVLRVKDMYAALWPFLGICAEVLILCAIILVYEKRRTKPELDDSDTDNHEQ